MSARLLFRTTVLTAPLLFAGPLFASAEERRSHDAHQHGVGAFFLAIEGDQVSMALETPAYDVLGFEYTARSEADRNAVAAAREKLSEPLALFVLPEAAGCAVDAVELGIGPEAGHDDHEEHADEGHDDHEEHADEGHDDHDEHAHEGHDDHDESVHSEVSALYELTCADPDRLDRIDLAYFDAFPNAEKLDVVLLLADGRQVAATATREDRILRFD